MLAWIKRIFLFLASLIVVSLGAGTAISAFTGQYGNEIWLILGLGLMGVLLLGLGLFLMRVAVKGPKKDVDDAIGF